MLDRDGVELVLGDRVEDINGITGEITKVSGCDAIKFEHKGKKKYIFANKVVSNEIKKVDT